MPRHAAFAALAAASPTLGAPMTLDVDATDIARGLVHATISMPARPGPMDLYYVEWTPGNHNPSGPIQNVVEMRITDDRGRVVAWERDPTDVVRVTARAPEGAQRLEVSFSYITDQPSVNSRSTDSYGRQTLGGISWNTLLWYPSGADKDELLVEASLALPEGWSWACNLDATSVAGGAVTFETVSLAQLVDSPIIFGRHLRTWDLGASSNGAPHFFHAVASDPADLELPGERVEEMRRMIPVTEAIFGPFPYGEYHFLVIADSGVPGFGLEHAQSTYISMSSDALRTAKAPDGSRFGVVPHEYIHAWNGKLRAPAGLLHRDFHTDGDARLLWVYEGLTSYYDDVVSARCGLLTPDEYREAITGALETYKLRTGRLWRSVEDTARAQRLLRARSERWEDLRRRQDYYGEGALFWMEADAIIRRGTNGERSLDDFVRSFFDVRPPSPGSADEYTRADVVRALSEVYSGEDWSALIERRIERPAERLEIDLPALLGYRFALVGEPTEEQARREKKGALDLRRSLAVVVSESGEITNILRGSAADERKLAFGMRIIGVNGRTWSRERLLDAVRAAGEGGEVELLLQWGDELSTVRLPAPKGMLYPRLERDGGDDLLSAIIHAEPEEAAP